MTVITISGQVGSGKSTLAKRIAETFGLRHVSAGAIMREMAREKGMDLIEFSKFAELNSSVDRDIDNRQLEMAKSGDCVVEGRISAHFIESDLRVYLITPLKVRAQRVMDRDGIKSMHEALERVKARESSEKKRYMKIYNIDFDDVEQYDLVINSASFTKEELADLVSAAVREVIKKD